jgi:hypothetical protein
VCQISEVLALDLSLLGRSLAPVVAPRSLLAVLRMTDCLPNEVWKSVSLEEEALDMSSSLSEHPPDKFGPWAFPENIEFIWISTR